MKSDDEILEAGGTQEDIDNYAHDVGSACGGLYGGTCDHPTCEFNKDKNDKLRRGDIVTNGYQSPPYNLYLIIGSTTRKTGQFSTTKYYKCQHIIDNELLAGDALFNKSDNKLEKVGYMNIKEVLRNGIIEAMKGVNYGK